MDGVGDSGSLDMPSSRYDLAMKSLSILTMGFALMTAVPSHADPLKDAVAADLPSLVSLYRDLHAQPELSGQEVKTAARLAREIKGLGFKVTSGVGGTGVVAVLENGPGPVLLLRTDLDALPITEATGLPYASKVHVTTAEGVDTGVMHACGHDIHMASWIGAARRLAALKQQWSGTLVMIAQPAEEIGKGARTMLGDGLYKRFPKPSAVIAFHDGPLPAGVIGYTPGYTFANVDSVNILVKGVGGHGAYPQATKDPVVLAARIVTTLQTIVSREIDPLESAVVTVGSIHGGTKHNIIPNEVRLQLTVRSFAPETRTRLLAAIERIAKGEAIAAGMPDNALPVVTVEDQATPATFNSEPLTGKIVARFREQFGPDRVRQVPPTMAGEDFSQYRLADPEGVQSLLFWVGAVPQAKWDEAKGNPAALPGLHSPLWAPDAEPTISTAVEAMTVAALDVLAKP
jgi:hippurate hydrolase